MVAVAVAVFRIIPRELVPVEDRGTAFGIVIAPEGSTLEYTDRYMQAVEARLLPLPERPTIAVTVPGLATKLMSCSAGAD